jgi:hypothetical protein
MAGVNATPGQKNGQSNRERNFGLYYRRVGHRADQFRRARWPALRPQTVEVSSKGFRRRTSSGFKAAPAQKSGLSTVKYAKHYINNPRGSIELNASVISKPPTNLNRLFLKADYLFI